MNFKTLTSLSLVLAGSLALVAQENTGTLTGTVRDKSGQVVSNARVIVTSSKLLGDRVTFTDAKGGYRIPLLPTGEYSITFSAKGHLSNKGRLTLIAGQILRQDGIIARESEVQSAGAVVEVVMAAAQVDKTETVTQTAYTGEKLRTMLPFGNGGLDMVALTPGVAGSGEQASIRGGVGASNALILNGGSAKSMVKNLFEMRVTIQDMVESASVLQSTMNAKFGNSDGGAIVWTTSRGSNEFSGSIRRTGVSRETWKADPNRQFQDRVGTPLDNRKAVQDALKGKWEITLKGPIIKDKLTFAYGGVLEPDRYDSRVRVKSYSDTPRPEDAGSIFFNDGQRIYRQGQSSLYDGKLVTFEEKDSWNQYTLYWQINDNHQMEGGLTKQFRSNPLNPLEWVPDVALPTLPSSSLGYPGKFEQDRQMWNVGYKGILGTQGLLEIRLSGKKEAYNHHTTATPNVRSWRMANEIPNLVTGNGTTLPSNMLEWWFGGAITNGVALAENGIGYGDHDTLQTFANTINYQHILDFKGTHVLDVGYSELASKMEDVNVKDLNFRTPVRLSDTDLPGVDAARYVVVPYNATVGSVAGGPINWTAYGRSFGADALVRDAASIYGRYLVTTMWKNAGPGDGIFRSSNRAVYVNDQWTLNDHHSVMVGLRMDHFKVWDATRTIHSYSQFTPRFEYKWDLAGDQRRIVSASVGQFASTPQSWYFNPYAQGYRPYRTREYWTGAAMGRTQNTPYLVSLKDLTNPANYGFVNQSQVRGAAGVAEILDSSIRGPVSTEATLGFRRSFTNGSFYRASLVYKTWDHLFNYFPAASGALQQYPQEFFPGQQPTQVLPRVFREDDTIKREYKGAEMEWNFVFTPRVSFGGNYTYSRMYANGNQEVMQNPMGADGNPMDWGTYLDTFVPRDRRDPVRLMQGGHTFNAFLSWDLSVGKLKQSVFVRGRYSSSGPVHTAYSYNIPRPTVPNYTLTTGLPTTVSEAFSPTSGFMSTDFWSTNLRYNLEVPVYQKLSWFLAVDVANWLNTIARSGYNVAGGFGNGGTSVDFANRGNALVNGPRFDRDTRGGEGRFGFRSVTLETGLRF